MKVNAIKFYTVVFVIVLFLQLYVYSFRFNIFFQLFVLSSFAILEKQTISLRFLKISLPIILIFLIGFLGMIFHRYNLFNITKDIFHFIKPIFSIFIGYCFYKRINDFKLFVKTIVVAGFLSALAHFVIVFGFSSIETVATIREHGTDNFMELMGLFFIAFYKKFQNEKLFTSKIIHRTILLTLLFSCILYFSRTMIVMAVIGLLSIYGFTILTTKSIKIIGIYILMLLCFYAFLFSINIQRNKQGFESFLYKVKNAPAEVFKTRIDKENHIDLWDHWRGYEAKQALELINQHPSNYLVGCGYGSLVNLKFYAPLTNDKKGMRYISELHNGYVYILYKTGIVGMILYLFFLFSLYMKIYFSKNFIPVFISIIGLSFIFTTLVTVGINNSNEALIFILGALLFFNEKQKVYT